MINLRSRQSILYVHGKMSVSPHRHVHLGVLALVSSLLWLLLLDVYAWFGLLSYSFGRQLSWVVHTIAHEHGWIIVFTLHTWFLFENLASPGHIALIGSLWSLGWHDVFHTLRALDLGWCRCEYLLFCFVYLCCVCSTVLTFHEFGFWATGILLAATQDT